MTNYHDALKHNPLLTYEDLETSLIQLLQPVYHVMAQQQTPGRFHLSDSGSVYGEDRRAVEGFLRTLWGLGPLFSHPAKTRQYSQLFAQANEGILAGTDPDSPFYWGELTDYDQLFVEMGALATYLILTKESFWDTLTASQQEALYQWTDQINHHVIPDTNWLFFRILINTFYECVGLPFSSAQLAEDLAKIDQYYLADGWYFDGYQDQIDYYIPFAMQYYGLLFTKLSKKQTLPQIASFQQRGRQFAKSFKDWFVTSGAALPFGRSLTYRFAQSAYFAAAFYGEIDFEDFTPKEAKYLLLHNLRNWYQQPIFTIEGFLTIGYGYPNLVMAEGYNAPGSPYWALKSYLILALAPKHPFWQMAEVAPRFPQQVKNPYSRMLLVHDPEGSELQAFTAGQHSHEHAHGEAKYEKFVYSTTFGFSVAKGSVLPKQGAFDNTLAVSEKATHFETVFGYQDFAITDDFVYGSWQPNAETTIRTWVVPAYPWHVRVHEIETKRPLNFLAGGFSAPAFGQHILESTTEVRYQSQVGTIGFKAFSPQISCQITQPEPNTNLLYSQTALVQGTFEVTRGKQRILYACLGAAFDKVPVDPDFQATLEGDQLVITHFGDTRQITLS